VFSQPGVKRHAAWSFRMARQTGPAVVWQVKVVAVALGDDRRLRHRLILARNRETGRGRTSSPSLAQQTCATVDEALALLRAVRV
jgi:hypothetical protein